MQILCAAVMPSSDMDLVCTGDKFGSMGVWMVEVNLFLLYDNDDRHDNDRLNVFGSNSQALRLVLPRTRQEDEARMLSAPFSTTGFSYYQQHHDH